MENNQVIRDRRRWDRACSANREALIYIEKYREDTLTDDDTRKFIALFNDMFYSVIERVSRKFVVPKHCDRDDLYQIALMALFACARKFDVSNKDAQFLAYLRRAVRNNIITYIRVITHEWRDIMLDTDNIDDYPNV